MLCSQRSVPNVRCGGNRRGTESFDEFISTQNVNCDINHFGSAGAMQSKDVVECFTSSVKKI